MKKSLWLSLLPLLVASQLSAAYIVVLKDGTQYKAKQRWTVSDGKALIQLETGSVLQLDPNMIDVEKTNEVNKLGLGDVKVLGRETRSTGGNQQDSSLGSSLKLRKPPATAGSVPSSTPPANAAPRGQGLGFEVTSKFEAAYENVGIFEHRVVSDAPAKLRVELITDNEERVFGAITATAFFMVGVPRSTGTPIDSVELFMRTTTGQPAGRFQMTLADAQAINEKKLTPQGYFVQKVLY